MIKTSHWVHPVKTKPLLQRRELVQWACLPSKESTEQAASSTTLSLPCSFRLDPLLQEGSVLQVIQPRNLSLLLRLLPIERQQRRDRIDHVPQRDAAHTAEIRAVHFHFHERHSAFFLSDSIFLHQLPDQGSDDLARAAPVGLPESQERRSGAC